MGSIHPSIDLATEGLTELRLTSGLLGLQSERQRHVLDVVAELRRAGLDTVLSLPQIVVCGDQSAGKSSVLEALTEIPFPRNDALCTRFPTEIILRSSDSDSLTVKIIPGNDHSSEEEQSLRKFSRTITDFSELPAIIEEAMKEMGLDENATQRRSFSKDVLSIEIQGPNRPHLSLVDLPGLIQTATGAVTDLDIAAVAEITERYISQPRTICLPVISALHDHANQGILKSVRKYDPEGKRTLGIITKPDRLEPGSDSERRVIRLAENKDYSFELGWHVLRNRNYQEAGHTFAQRNTEERQYFQRSAFNILPGNSLGIDHLRSRLSDILFQHVCESLPQLQRDIDSDLEKTEQKLAILGPRRTTARECKEYLIALSQDYHHLCSAAEEGFYQDQFFTSRASQHEETISKRRLRACVQDLNYRFARGMEASGHEYNIQGLDSGLGFGLPTLNGLDSDSNLNEEYGPGDPIYLSAAAAVKWVEAKIKNARGQELAGNFNPLIIAELFWEQSKRWKELAEGHMVDVSEACEGFLKELLDKICPKGFQNRLWEARFQDSLRNRQAEAAKELEKLVAEQRKYPINYDSRYIETIKKQRFDRYKLKLQPAGYEYSDVPEAAPEDPNDVEMLHYNCAEALDSLNAIYKLQLTNFISNVTTQVVERHIVSNLRDILSSVTVSKIPEEEVQTFMSEYPLVRRERESLEERLVRLKEGKRVLRSVLRG